MPRRRRQSEFPFPLQMLLVVGAMASCVWILQRKLGVVVFIGFVLATVVGIVRFVLPSLRKQAILGKADAMILRYADQLSRRRVQLVRQDAYGKSMLDKWHGEIEHFAGEHIRPSLTSMEQAHLTARWAEYMSLIGAHIEQFVPHRNALDGFTESMNPSEFEAFCAEQLRKAGWEARVTQTSRDQGTDVIAEKGQVRIVLQCKLYSNPVGNKAVQEIVAGRAQEQANYGAVVTNSSYTAPAEELAATNGILLLHYSDLPQLDDVLRSSPLTRSVSAGT